jgi:hypothetical protein
LKAGCPYEADSSAGNELAVERAVSQSATRGR